MVRAVPVLLILALSLACAQPGDTGSSPTPAPTPTDRSVPSGVDGPANLPRGPTPVDLEMAPVVNVVDGDTIDVLIDGQEFRIRYIGIDTPETVDPRRPVECFGREASERNRELVDARTVGLERDVSETDRFGRILRYVWVNPSTGSGQAMMVNARLVEEGYATASVFPPDVRHAETFAALEAQAREEERGLWGPACLPPQPSPAAGGLCDHSATDEPVIKGNISVSTSEKIYHVPGGEFYEQTVINEAKGERWFCSEAEAAAAGWRKSKR